MAGDDIASGCDDNTFVGYLAGYTADAGAQAAMYNTYVGSQAGRYMDDAEKNTAVGYGALYGTSTGNTAKFNVAVGLQSLEDVTSGLANIGIGAFAGSKTTTGSSNVSIGSNDGTLVGALRTNTVGSFNIAIGTAALALANENDNDGTVAIGHLACTAQAGTGGAQFANATVGIGYKALTALTTGAKNIAIGYNSML